MTTDDHEEFDSFLPWCESRLITTEEVLDFLDIYHSHPLRNGELAHLIAEGFTYSTMYRLGKELYLYKDQETLIWDDVIEPIRSKRVAKPNKLSSLESSRVFHLALCLLVARKVFMGEVRTRYFLLNKHGEFSGKTPLECIMEGRGTMRQVMELLESLPHWDLIPARYYRNEG